MCQNTNLVHVIKWKTEKCRRSFMSTTTWNYTLKQNSTNFPSIITFNLRYNLIIRIKAFAYYMHWFMHLFSFGVFFAEQMPPFCHNIFFGVIWFLFCEHYNSKWTGLRVWRCNRLQRWMRITKPVIIASCDITTIELES